MPDSSKVRKPQQKRSIEKKERILTAAYALFAEKGFYKTSTPEIAVKAGVSTGALYSYFTDKHMIFMELLGQASAAFDALICELENALQQPHLDFSKYFRTLFTQMIHIHVKFRPLLMETDALSYTDMDIHVQMQERNEKIQENLLHMMQRHRHLFRVDDLEAAAIVLYEMIDALVDRAAFQKNDVSNERIVDEGMQAICRYLQMEGDAGNAPA